jgi:uncharacterized protein with von Willebrand factor type A (vWA) domain
MSLYALNPQRICRYMITMSQVNLKKRSRHKIRRQLKSIGMQNAASFKKIVSKIEGHSVEQVNSVTISDTILNLMRQPLTLVLYICGV